MPPTLRAAAALLCAAASASAGFLERTGRFHALGAEEAYALYVPPQKPRTAIVFLHGLGRDHRTLIDNAETRKVLESSRSLILLPRGQKSWWVGAHEAYLLELIDRIATEFDIPRAPERWAMGGWSMGGYGSLRFVERHPDRFCAWAGLLALADFPNPSYPPAQNHAVPALFGPPESWPDWNPLRTAEHLRGKAVWFTTGKDAFDRSMNETLDATLTRSGIPHQFRVVEGAHTFPVVAANLGPALAFLENAIDAR